MATSFFGGNYFGGEYFSAGGGPAPSTGHIRMPLMGVGCTLMALGAGLLLAPLLM